MSKMKDAYAEELRFLLSKNQLFPPEATELNRALDTILPSFRPRGKDIESYEDQSSLF